MELMSSSGVIPSDSGRNTNEQIKPQVTEVDGFEKLFSFPLQYMLIVEGWCVHMKREKIELLN